MAQNYFTDIVGGTQQAFQRGQQAVESARQQIGQNQAARALARGDTRAAREAYGRAGMVEQVDILGQREAAQTEAMRKQKEQAEALAYTRQQDADKMARQAAADKLQYLGNVSQALLQIPKEQRAQALSMFGNTFQAMGLPPDTISQLSQQDLSDDNLRMFGTAMGQEMEKIQLPSTMGAIPTGYMYDPETGELRPVPGGPQAMPRATTAAAAPRAPSGYRYTPEGDLTPIPGGPADKQAMPSEPKLNPTLAREAAKKFAAATPFRKALQNFKQAVLNSDFLAQGGFGAKGATLETTHRALAMQLKGPAGLDLGALVGPDFAILNDMIGEPGRVDKFYAKGGKEGARAKLDAIEQLLNDREAALRDEYSIYANTPELKRFYQPRQSASAQSQRGFILRSGEPGAPPPSPQATVSGGNLSAAEQAELEQLRRELGGG
jgi:hypothetical protein